MARHINLYDPALLRKRDWFALGNVVLGALLALLLVAAAGFATRAGLPGLADRAAAGETQLHGLREQVRVLGQHGAKRQADPRIAAELEETRLAAQGRNQVLEILRRKVAEGRPPFAEPLRGLARQSMTGVWITGFSWDAAGDRIEIRGRTVDPALLPDYLRRLSREPAFRGRAFAALDLVEGKLEPVAGAPAQKAPFHEFTLTPLKSDAGADAAAVGRPG
ncbi:MAG: PilN domain-containing protein [Sulfuritalea sp.]|nr:PilN domain-containing protein [Sulfuritalea sp.]